MTTKPAHDYLLVEPIKEPTETESGLTIPATVREAGLAKATVLETGPGLLKDGVHVTMPDVDGWTAYYPRHKTIDIGSIGLKLVRYADIVAWEKPTR